MELVHDCLDAQLLDRDGTKFGRIDSVVLAVDDDGPPRVVAIELGTVPLAARFSRRLGAWWERRGGHAAYRLPWSALRRDGNDFRADVDATRTPAWTAETWLRERLVRRLPGG